MTKPRVGGVIDDLGSWVDGLLGGAFSGAASRVNTAIRTGQVDALIKPEVERFISAIGRWNGALKRAEDTAQANPGIADAGSSAFLADQRGKLGVMWGQFRDYSIGKDIPGEPPVVGMAPLVPICTVLVAGSVAVGVSALGAAWALSSYETAQSELKKTELAAKELDARVLALKEGKTLQPFTLPDAAAGGDTGMKPMTIAVGSGIAFVTLLGLIGLGMAAMRSKG